jgi:hypothetical protein
MMPRINIERQESMNDGTTAHHSIHPEIDALDQYIQPGSRRRGRLYEIETFLGSATEEPMSTVQEQFAGTGAHVRQVLMRRYPDHFMLFVDLFAMGCVLHLQGERCAGYRLVAQVLDKLEESPEKPYLNALLRNLSGNEIRLAREIEPNQELSQLCDRAQITHYREAACAR